MGIIKKILGHNGKGFRREAYAALWLVVILFSPTVAQGANIEAKVDTSDGTSGFVVQDSGGNEVTRINSKGNVGQRSLKSLGGGVEVLYAS